jgi:hypothetical protein
MCDYQSVMEIFMTLSSGATLCAASRKCLLTDPEATIRSLGCTHMMATPSMAMMLKPERLDDTFELWTMGELCHRRLIDTFGTDHVLMNAYVSVPIFVLAVFSNAFFRVRLKLPSMSRFEFIHLTSPVRALVLRCRQPRC